MSVKSTQRHCTWRHLFACSIIASLIVTCAGKGNFGRLIRRKEQEQPSHSFKKPSSSSECDLDRAKKPILENLSKCQNSSMFLTWRPKARVIAPRGWMNDPSAIFEIKNGTFHIGYQCNVHQLVWGNISQCAASTTDFVHFNDYNSWKDPTTLAPNKLYDIGGVFDGNVIKDGWDGYPTLIYTSVTTGPIGAQSNPPEHEGVETQSLAYTKDDGHTWIRLDYGAKGNPAIYKWPEKNITGFRDPFVFESDELLNFYTNSATTAEASQKGDLSGPTGSRFLLLSGGIRADFNPDNAGPGSYLYRQTEDKNVRDWTYLGPFFSLAAERKPASQWRGADGLDFECLGFTEINELGRVTDSSSSEGGFKLKIATAGSEGGRNKTHGNYWPLWHSLKFEGIDNNKRVKTTRDFSGVLDWGRTYAFFLFPAGQNRQIGVGWIYEDDANNALTPQRGYQGAFTLFRDLFVKVIRNLHPSALESPEDLASWKIQSEADGSQSVVTVGQKILPEILRGFKQDSDVIPINPRTLDHPNSAPDNLEIDPRKDYVTKLVEFESQPSENFYVIQAQLDFFPNQYSSESSIIQRPDSVRGGFRIMSSEHEWTDIYYDPADEYLTVERKNSSVLSCYGSDAEKAKHRLWPILDPVTGTTNFQSLNLTIIVDNSVVEVHANEQTIITTRVYPWYKKSVGVQFLAQGSEVVIDPVHTPRLPPFAVNHTSKPERMASPVGSVKFSNVELWDGLPNAWPLRPHDTSRI